MKTIGLGFSRFRRCYMTRVTAAGAPGRFLCSNNVALTGVYVQALLFPVISTFNDRNGKTSGQKWLGSPGKRMDHHTFTSYVPLFSPSLFFSFALRRTAEPSRSRDEGSRAAIVTRFPCNFAGSRENKERRVGNENQHN